MLNKILKYTFLLAVFTYLISHQLEQNYRSVDLISDQLYQEPKQTETTDRQPISFSSDGYQYSLTPLFDYEIKALIVHEMKYDTWYSLYSRNNVFTKDLCLMWGESLKNNYFRSKSLSFSQDARFCNFMMTEKLPINFQEISNNHLLTNNLRVKKIIESLHSGDQVKIKGKLVNVEARQMGEIGKHDSSMFSMNTSVTRTDSGAGACEVIYVEDIEIIKPAHPILSLIATCSRYLIFLILGVVTVKFLVFVFRKDKLY